MTNNRTRELLVPAAVEGKLSGRERGEVKSVAVFPLLRTLIYVLQQNRQAAATYYVGMWGEIL